MKTSDDPGLELIKFIGAFSDSDTGWIDPFLLPPGKKEASQITGEEKTK